MALPFKKPSAPIVKPNQQAESRFAGIKMDEPRDPMPTAGDYVFKVLEHKEAASPKTRNTSLRVKLEVMQSDGQGVNPVGSTVFLMFATSGNGAQSGFKRLKSFVYNTLDMGEASDAEIAAACDEACEGSTGNLVGRIVCCTVRRGNNVIKDGVDTGDYYREYDWVPASALEGGS